MIAIQAWHVLTPEDMKEQALRSGKGKDCTLEQLRDELQNFNLDLNDSKGKRFARTSDLILGPLMSVPLDICYAVSHPLCVH
jgi:hypothetical protein